jgi:hypothetical protein
VATKVFFQTFYADFMLKMNVFSGVDEHETNFITQGGDQGVFPNFLC